ncbi:MAG: MerR family transcriptional regulator [Myxococcales bacterium]|nr:MerR family transcriptional regulator [Myxococcales bacterium]
MALTIGNLAKAVGVGVETVRFYEREKLIPKPPRTKSGYRQYPEDTLERVRFIRLAKELGFTLAEISELLELRVGPTQGCDDVEAKARGAITRCRVKIDELERMSRALGKLADACSSRPHTSDCPIIEILEGSADG